MELLLFLFLLLVLVKGANVTVMKGPREPWTLRYRRRALSYAARLGRRYAQDD